MYNILLLRMRISQNLDLFSFFFFYFLLALSDFFLALFLLFSLSSTPHILSVTRKKLGVNNR